MNPWIRPNFRPGGDDAAIDFFLFADAAWSGAPPLSRAQHGLPGEEVPEEIEVTQIAADADRAWFDGFFADGLGAIAERDLGPQLGAARGAAHVLHVRRRFLPVALVEGADELVKPIGSVLGAAGRSHKD